MSEEVLINRFCKLNLNKLSEEQFKTDANSLLDELLSFAHWTGGEKSGKDLCEQNFCTFVTYGCRLLEGKNHLLRSKFANTVYLFLVNQKKNLSQDSLSCMLNFLLSSNVDWPETLKIYFLQALGAVVYENGARIEMSIMEGLLGPSSQFLFHLDLSKGNYSIQSEVVQCIGNLCLKSKDGGLIDKAFIKMLYQKVTDFLRQLLNLHDEENPDLYKLVSRTLKVLQTIMGSISFQDGIVEPDFAIALLRVFLVYGSPGFHSAVAHLLKNLPSARAAPPFDAGAFSQKAKSPLIKQVVKKKRKGKKASGKKQLNFEDKGDRFSDYSDRSSFDVGENLFNISHGESVASGQSSSESEFSDSESGSRNRLRSIWSRIRHNSLKCIQDILRCFDRRGKLSSWLLLAPETVDDLEPSLITTLMNDTSSKVRLSCVACLTELFNNSKPYLDAAVNRSHNQSSPTRAFEPFSVRLNQSLVLIHETFIQILRKRNFDITTDKILQSISVLVLNTPYDKIGSELLYNVAELVPHYLNTDVNVTISSLTCLAATMSVKPDDKRIFNFMFATPKAFSVQLVEKSEEKPRFSSWIVAYCYEQLDKDQPDSLDHERIINQCLQVFKIIVQFYPDLLLRNEKEASLSLISHKYIKMAESMVSFHAIKLVEEFGKHFSKNVNGKKDEGISFWNTILDGPLLRLFQSPDSVPKVMAAACDVISTLCPEILEVLSIRYQIMCKTLLLGAANDEDNSIKSAAVRALGIFVTYPFVKEDDSFMMDVGGVIFTQLRSQFVSVRLKAGWALGNFTDSLIKNKSLSENEDATEFSTDFLYDLLNASKQAAMDHDKVKPNGVRAVGNILRWLPKSVVEQKTFQHVITEAVDSLTQNILTGPMKGRWNACYASSNMFQSQSIHLGASTWTENILMALASSLKECKNFKVRISAAVALSTPHRRENYGNEELFYKIWRLLIEALISSEDLSDFTEFKFKGNLQNKICHLFFHFLGLATPTDFARIQTLINENLDLIQFHLGKFAESLGEFETEYAVDDSQKSGLSLEELNRSLMKYPENFEGVRAIISKLAAS